MGNDWGIRYGFNEEQANMLRRHVESALKRLSPDPTEALPLLYPMSALSEPCGNRLSPVVIERIASFQVCCVDGMLKQRLNASLGLADDRVVVLNVRPDMCDYSVELLKTVAESSALHPDDRLVVMENLAARLWRLDGSGLSRVGIPRVVVAGIHDNSQEKRAGSSAQSNHADAHYPAATPSNTSSEVLHSQCILVVLGVLPMRDKLDVFLFENERRLAHPVAPGTRQDGSPAALPPMSAAKYWNAFARYLSNRTNPAPVTPGTYRKLLEARQQQRDQRLRCLQAYTGIRRANAKDTDALAEHRTLFFRFGELLIQEAGMGVVSLAADTSWLTHPSAEGMRKSLLATFDRIFIDELDEGAFFDATTPEGVLCGMIKKPFEKQADCMALYRRHNDAKTLSDSHDVLQYQPLAPNELNHLSLRLEKIPGQYPTWLSVTEIAGAAPLNGAMEKRNGALVDSDRPRLEKRMRMYFDKKVPWSCLVSQNNGMTAPQSRYDPQAVRKAALAATEFKPDAIRPYLVKPFDTRFCYYSTVKSIWGEPKPQFAELVQSDNRFVAVRANKAVADEGVPFFHASCLGDSDLMRGHAYYFPTWCFGEGNKRIANISDRIIRYLSALGLWDEASSVDAAHKVWNHVLSIGFSPLYLDENDKGIGQGWPRIPFPSPRHGVSASSAFLESARLGEIVAGHLAVGGDAGSGTFGVSGVGGRHMAIPWNVRTDVPVSLEGQAGIPLTVNWGKLGGEKTVLPSHGRLLSREYAAEEKRFLEGEARMFGVYGGGWHACLGDKTFDVYLNDKTMIKNIPSKVWEFTIGGFQVLKKWLSYRETAIMGRPLLPREVGVFIEAVRHIAELLLLGPRLNRNYAVNRDLHSPFSGQ